MVVESGETLCTLALIGDETEDRILFRYQAAKRSRIPFFRRATGFAILGRPIVDESVPLDVDEAKALILAGVREHPHGPRLFDLDPLPDS